MESQNPLPSTNPTLDLLNQKPVIPDDKEPRFRFGRPSLLAISLLLLVASMVILGASIWYVRSSIAPETPAPQPLPENSPVDETQLPTSGMPAPESASILENSSDPEKRIVFMRNPDRDQANRLQAWIMNPDGSQAQQLPLTNIGSAYKPPLSSLVFYTKNNQTGSIFVRNLNTEAEISLQPLVHPDPQVSTWVSISDLENISPDGKYFIFSPFFTKPCPEITGETAGMGSGPCQPDPDPNISSGMHLFDLQKQTITALVSSDNDTVRLSRWDTEGQKLYLINTTYQRAGLDEVDLVTKRFRRVDHASHFGYGAWPLFKSNHLIRNDASTGENGNEQSFSTTSLINQDTGVKKVIAEGQWADVQPFTSISPAETSFLYLRTERQNSNAVGGLYLYTLATGENIRVTPATFSESYSIHGVWIDDNTYITLVDTIETDQYYNGNNYLISIDIPTGKITRLTPGNDVFRFTNL